jgi:iron complex transport system substrate-binding protein
MGEINMGRKIFHWLAGIFCLAIVCLAAGCSLPEANLGGVDDGSGYDVVDDQGTRVHIPGKPRRILAGNLAFDTMILGITTPDHLVAVNILDRDPLASFISEDVKSVKLTSRSLTGISLETVVKAKPDVLILPDWNSKNDIDMFRSLGYAVVVLKGPSSVEDVRHDILRIAEVLGETERGRKVVKEMDRQLAEIDETLSKRTDREPVGLLVSQMTSWGGPGSIYDELARRARVKNGIAEAGLVNGQELTKEGVLKADPDFFLVSATKNGKPSKFQKEWFHDPSMQHMKGIHHIIALPNRYIYCASQNIPDAIRAIANAAYGPVFDMSQEKLIRGY